MKFSKLAHFRSSFISKNLHLFQYCCIIIKDQKHYHTERRLFMVDPVKATAVEFKKEYGCSRKQALKAAQLNNELYENQSAEIIALGTVLRKRGYSLRTTAVLCIQVSALAIWRFTDYRPITCRNKRYISKDDKTPINLATDIYPLTSMVLELTPDTVTTKLRAFAKEHEGGKLTPKQLILSVLDEAMKTK